jgi:hypothetical protein
MRTTPRRSCPFRRNARGPPAAPSGRMMTSMSSSILSCRTWALVSFLCWLAASQTRASWPDLYSKSSGRNMAVVDGSCRGAVWKLGSRRRLFILGASAANGDAQAGFTRHQVQKWSESVRAGKQRAVSGENMSQRWCWRCARLCCRAANKLRRLVRREATNHVLA